MLKFDSNVVFASLLIYLIYYRYCGCSLKYNKKSRNLLGSLSEHAIIAQAKSSWTELDADWDVFTWYTYPRYFLISHSSIIQFNCLSYPSLILSWLVNQSCQLGSWTLESRVSPFSTLLYSVQYNEHCNEHSSSLFNLLLFWFLVNDPNTSVSQRI